MTEDISNVKLEDFVAEVLKQIINGVVTAQKHAAENKAYINSSKFYKTPDWIFMSNSTQDRLVQEIDFDVAITVSAQSNLKGGVGIFIPAAGIGYQAQKDAGNATISRIKFQVPIALPQQE